MAVQQRVILVTGAGGFVGRHLCERLHADGEQVVALDRDLPGGLPYETVRGDIIDGALLATLFYAHPNCTVVHLASMLNTASREQPREAARYNIDGSLRLLELAGQYGVTRFIYASTISVYGTKRFQTSGAVAETEPAAPEDVYGIAKRYVEVAGRDYARQHGIQFVVLRIASVVGPGADSASSSWRSEIFEKLAANTPATIDVPFRGDQMIPLVHVEDVAAMLARLVGAERPRAGIYNTPADSWYFDGLGDYIASLKGDIKFVYGTAEVRGIPQAIDGHRFAEEFGLSATPIAQRLAGSVTPGSGAADSQDGPMPAGDS